jgi:hypothetical protein
VKGASKKRLGEVSSRLTVALQPSVSPATQVDGVDPYPAEGGILSISANHPGPHDESPTGVQYPAIAVHQALF